MSTINLTFKDRHAIMELARPKAHAINQRMVHDMREAFAKLAASDRLQGVVLTAPGSIFCAGLDVVELFGYDDVQMDHFWESFGRLLKDMVGFPKPLIAAVNGHAPAGGCVFALCCDYRLMARGDGRIGLNEVPVGIVIPEPIVELARHVVGDRKASEMILSGALLLPEDAERYGLIHQVVAPGELLQTAEAQLLKWTELPAEPWSKAKASLRRPLLKAIDLEFSQAFGATIHEWWSVETRTRVAKMVERLSKNRS